MLMSDDFFQSHHQGPSNFLAQVSALFKFTTVDNNYQMFYFLENRPCLFFYGKESSWPFFESPCFQGVFEKQDNNSKHFYFLYYILHAFYQVYKPQTLTLIITIYQRD